MSYTKKITLIIVLIFLSVLFFVNSVNAETTPDTSIGQDINTQLNAFGGEFGANTEQTSDVRIIVARIIRIFLSLMATITVAYIIYGGYLYMTSGGSDERIGKAQKIIFYGAIGLAIMLTSFSIVSFVYKSIYGVINPWDGGWNIYTQQDNSKYSKDPMGGSMVPDQYNVDWGKLTE